jgi:hypothetical protein
MIGPDVIAKLEAQRSTLAQPEVGAGCSRRTSVVLR